MTHTSAFQSLTSALIALLHLSVVISSTRVIHLGMGLIATKSTPIMIEFAGICFAATCSHPPGAAHKSITQRAVERKSYFLLSWISLKADRARYPCSLMKGTRERMSFLKVRCSSAEEVSKWDLLGERIPLIQTTGRIQQNKKLGDQIKRSVNRTHHPIHSPEKSTSTVKFFLHSMASSPYCSKPSTSVNKEVYTYPLAVFLSRPPT